MRQGGADVSRRGLLHRVGSQQWAEVVVIPHGCGSSCGLVLGTLGGGDGWVRSLGECGEGLWGERGTARSSRFTTPRPAGGSKSWQGSSVPPGMADERQLYGTATTAGASCYGPRRARLPQVDCSCNHLDLSDLTAPASLFGDRGWSGGGLRDRLARPVYRRRFASSMASAGSASDGTLVRVIVTRPGRRWSGGG